MRHRGLDRLPHTAEVDVDGLVEDVLAHLVQLHACRTDACVGDHDVEPPELLDAAADGGRQGVEVAYVDFGRDDAPIQVLDHVRGFGEVLRRGRGRCRVVEPAADVDRDDVGAFLRQPYRMAAALAASGTGDECDLAFHPSGHGTSNSLGSCWATAQHLC